MHPSHLDRHGRQQRIRDTLKDVGLPADREFLRRFPHQLSGGQQQRVMLALAFVLRPRLIVLDEPTTALDVTTQAHILGTLRHLCKSLGVAAIYVSHDLAVIKDLVDRVLVMYAGRILESASREALFRQPAHPYTRGLLAAIPDVGQRRPLLAIPGQAPAPGPAQVSPAGAGAGRHRESPPAGPGYRGGPAGETAPRGRRFRGSARRTSPAPGPPGP